MKMKTNNKRIACIEATKLNFSIGWPKGEKERERFGQRLIREFLRRCANFCWNTRAQYAMQAPPLEESGEPRREHYAVHLAFSLINGGGAGVNTGVVARLCSLSLSLSVMFFSPALFPFLYLPHIRDEIVFDFFQDGKNPDFFWRFSC